MRRKGPICGVRLSVRSGSLRRAPARLSRRIVRRLAPLETLLGRPRTHPTEEEQAGEEEEPVKAVRFPADEAKHPWLPVLLRMHALVDAGIAAAVRSEERRRGVRRACRSGCDVCCRTQSDIPVFQIELAGISWYCAEKLEGSARAAVRAGLERHVPGARECPFLVSGPAPSTPSGRWPAASSPSSAALRRRRGPVPRAPGRHARAPAGTAGARLPRDAPLPRRDGPEGPGDLARARSGQHAGDQPPDAATGAPWRG